MGHVTRHYELTAITLVLSSVTRKGNIPGKGGKMKIQCMSIKMAGNAVGKMDDYILGIGVDVLYIMLS